MLADPKELLAWGRNIGGRRAEENRRVNKLAASSSALTLFKKRIDQIKEFGLHELQINRIKRHKNSRFLPKDRLIAIPT